MALDVCLFIEGVTDPMATQAMRSVRSEKGSLALEQVLFIAAVIAMSAGLYAFYNNLGGHFRSVDLSAAETVVPSASAAGTGATP